MLRSLTGVLPTYDIEGKDCRNGRERRCSSRIL